jgi:hypothetical protein
MRPTTTVRGIEDEVPKTGTLSLGHTAGDHSDLQLPYACGQTNVPYLGAEHSDCSAHPGCSSFFGRASAVYGQLAVPYHVSRTLLSGFFLRLLASQFPTTQICRFRAICMSFRCVLSCSDTKVYICHHIVRVISDAATPSRFAFGSAAHVGDRPADDSSEKLWSLNPECQRALSPPFFGRR